MVKKISVIVFLLGIFLASCNPDEEKIKITILGENTANIFSFMTLEEEYEKLNPNVDLVFKPNTFADALTKSTQDFANGTGLYDIVMQYNFSLSSFVRNDYVYTLTELKEMLDEIPEEELKFEDDLFPQTWFTVASYHKDPDDPAKGYEFVGYPFAANTMLLMYNKEFFNDATNVSNYQKQYGKELTVPTTWEDFKTVAAFFTDPEKETYGVCLEGGSGGFLYYEFMNFLFGFGGEVSDKDAGWQGNANTQILLDEPQALLAAKFFDELRPYTSGNFTDVGQSEEMVIMKKGNTAMSISWDDIISSAVQEDESGEFKSKFGFAPIPGEKSVLGGGAFFVNKQSKHPLEVMKFILYVMQPSSQKKLALAGLSSPLKSIYNDPEVRKLPHIDALKISLERAGGYSEAGPDADMISETITTYLQKAWLDEISPEEAIQKATSEIESKRKGIFERVSSN